MRAIAIGVILAGCSFDHRVGGADVDAPIAIDTPSNELDAAVPMTCLDGLRCRRRTITLHHTEVSGGPFSDFPILVHFHDPGFKDNARADGFDLVFTAGDGTTRLAYERETFDHNMGDLVAWVRVPTLRGDADQTLYLYYGTAGGLDQADRTGTWPAAFAAVYHLGDGDHASLIVDSTANHNDAGVTTATDLASPVGQISKCAGLDNGDGIQSAQSASLGAAAASGTISMWVKLKMANTGAYQSLMTSGNRFAGDMSGFEFADQGGTGNLYFYPHGDADGGGNNLATAPFVDNTWAYAAVSYDLATASVDLFVNGMKLPLANTGVNATTWTTAGSPTTWMWGTDTLGRSLTGSLDELRVQTVARHGGWIATEYANQLDPTKLATLGPEDVLTQ